MAQGTVTDYFPKKRKGTTFPASKRPRLAKSLEEDLFQDTSVPVSKDNLTTKPAVKQTSRARGKTKTRTKPKPKSNVNSNKRLDSYFQKITTGTSNHKEEPDLHDGTDMLLSPSQEHLSIHQGKDSESNCKSNVVIKAKIPQEGVGSAHHEQIDESGDGVSVAAANVASLQNANDKSAGEKPLTEEKGLFDMRNDVKSDNSAATCSSSDAKSTVERLKSATEALMAKETAESLREKLKTRGDLKSLQESLMKIHQLKKQQKQREKISEKIRDEKPEVENSTMPSTPKKQEYAYETLHSLSQEIPEGLSLPYKYKILSELFRCTDIVVSMLFNRKQVVTWTNLQKSVQEMVRKNYEMHHLAQIKTVFPTGYQFRQEQGIGSVKDRTKQSEYQLTVEPMFDESDRFGGEKKLSSGMLTKRRHHFSVQLINIVHKHHLQFLSQLDPPMEIPEGKTIRRWHPQFPLDSIPEPESAELPQPPEKVDKCSNAKDILDKARSRFTKKAFDALKKVAERSTSSPEKPPITCVEENNNECFKKVENKMKPAEIKGISQSLLAKVRAKEAEKKLKNMVRSEEVTKKLQQLDNLPDVARALRMLYTSEKRASLPVEYICKKLVKCSTGVLTEIAVEEHIQLLVKTVPNWLNGVSIKSTNYVKMNKGIEVNVILERLTAERKKLANSV